MNSLWRLQGSGRPFGLLLTASGDLVEREVFTSNFDPTVDWAPTGWWRAPYQGAPWFGENYGAVGRSIVGGTAPSGGTLQNGYRPASFDGAGDYLVSEVPIEDFVTSGLDFSSFAVLKVDPGTLPADSTPVYDCPQIWSNSAGNAGIAVSAGGFRFWHYDTIAPYHSTPVFAVTDWSGYHVVITRTVGATLEVSLDGGATWESDTIGGSYASLGGAPLEVGRNYDASAYLFADVLEIGFLDRAVSDTEASTYLAYAVARYSLATGIPCLVVMTDGSIRQRPTVAPWGKRIIWDGAKLVCAVSTGKSLVIATDGNWRQAATGESVLVPP